MNISASILALVVMLCAPWARAQQAGYVAIEQRLTAEQMRQTGLDQLSPEQLQRLNQILGGQAAQQAAATAAAVAATAPPRERGNESLIGFNDEPIRARLKGRVAGWEPGTVFELDNGQQWKVLKGRMTLSRPLDAPEIRVVPGVAGRWFLEVDEDTPKARVYRID